MADIEANDRDLVVRQARPSDPRAFTLVAAKLMCEVTLGTALLACTIVLKVKCGFNFRH